MTTPAISNFEDKKLTILDILKKNGGTLSEVQIQNFLDKNEVIFAEIKVILKYLLLNNEIDSKVLDGKEVFIVKK